MRLVIQRVSSASVTISDEKVADIQNGLLILLGIEESDSQEDIDWLVGKVARLRIFNDDENVMNRSVVDVDGEVIVVSQFTLYASTKKGNRPSYIKAAPPVIAIPLYEEFVKSLSVQLGKQVQTGQFGADMKIALVNDGPVTILIDSKSKE